ncbi:endonuclease/exonuclease/phosphatase family protein [Fictibacillus phosphorivorans]|uniref:endonuclease/exonuclease/phosphatase family protein n=1 Tax=Fictibacillus phosphorivorans TaxID=1221500 RepID=UPI00203B4F95|nr:endonuclease/exonuclease/phosphatase family protein [Fictibacillus phosphorivorans]MCM3719582.1 endonuclease/exonuclease/phosphatase family protein [Fictibacillus phosphorivorans]MCM3777273.1 endonuclease/exonuclease/phosphatase family protein [Fictibacillus phosphorivorans]
MKLLTLNVHGWQEENQMEKLKMLARDIANERYDVIALQEVMQSIDAPIVNKNIKANNYALVLNQLLQELGVNDYDFVWDMAHYGFVTYEEGVAILTRHPIKSSNSFFVTELQDMNNWKTRKIISAAISYQGKELTFFSGHFGWWNDDIAPFKEQIDAFFKHVPESGISFLMGDLNNDANVRGEGFDYVKSNGFYDTYELAKEKDDGLTIKGAIAGWNQNGKEDGRRIDYILCNNPVNVKSSFVRFNGIETPVVSDHAGVAVTLDLEN